MKRFLADMLTATAAIAGFLFLLATMEQHEADYIAAAMAQRAAESTQAEPDAQLKAGCEIVACERLGAR
jgi:hypothetical protein